MKKEDMYRYAAKDDKGIGLIFPTTMGVYYDFREKVAVATNGHIVCVSKSAYDPRYERPGMVGVSIDKNGNEIGERFVKYRTAIPYYGRHSRTLPINKKEVKGIIKQAKDKAKAQGVKFDSCIVKVNGLWINEKYLKMVMDVIDETIHPTNPLQNKFFYGEKNGEEVMVSYHAGPDLDWAGWDAKVALCKKGEYVFSC